MADRVIKDEQPRVFFNCSKCPAFCCSVYERVEVTKRDLNRLARHFGVTPEVAREAFELAAAKLPIGTRFVTRQAEEVSA